MIPHTRNPFAGWVEALDVLHEDRQQAALHSEPQSAFSPSDLLPHQVMQIEQIRRMTERPSPWLARPMVAPLRAIDIDAALLDYHLADLLLMEVMELLAMEFSAPEPEPQSYPIANLPYILQPDPDPFRVRPSQALNRRLTCRT